MLVLLIILAAVYVFGAFLPKFTYIEPTPADWAWPVDLAKKLIASVRD